MVASTNSEQDKSDLVRKLDLEGHFTYGSSPLNADLLSELSKNRGFKLTALNITSIPGHIEELRIYVNSDCIDILAVNETRLDDTISSGEVTVPGYALERNDRNTDGGGVALYIRNTINYERLFDLECESLEWIGIKVIKPKAKSFIVSTWYRPPRSNVDTMKDFKLLVQRIESLGLEVNILGDLNCNVAACPLESHTKNLLEICNLYQYHQLINEHTRITEKSAATIDLFLTNNKEIFTQSGVRVCHIGISDHSLIYGVRKFCIPKGKPKIVESRQFRNLMQPWHLVHLEDNPNRAWEIWSRLFLEICDFHAPKRKRKVRNNYAPWLTPEIKRMMFERDKLKRAAIINNSDAHWTKYKIA